MNCAELFEQAGWRCAPVTEGSTTALYVSTPFILGRNKPMDFYLIETGDHVEFTDDGTTILSLRSLGYPLQDARTWRGLQRIAEGLGVCLEQDGAFTYRCIRQEFANGYQAWLRLFAQITEWEAEKVQQGDSDLWLTLEVERLLQEKAPNEPIEIAPKINVRETELEFDFKFRNTYIDAVPLHAGAINSRLRKALLLAQADEEIAMLFVVDDRQSIGRADREVALLGQVTRAIALRRLAELPMAA